jgi:hypothetical protein
VLSYVYELPFGRNKPFASSGPASWLAGGWRTSGIYTFSSGLPFTVTSSSNLSLDVDIYGQATSLPVQVGKPKVVGNVNCWFYYSGNKTCPSLSPDTTDAYLNPSNQVSPYGNGSINSIEGPKTSVFDFALIRDFQL